MIVLLPTTSGARTTTSVFAVGFAIMSFTVSTEAPPTYTGDERYILGSFRATESVSGGYASAAHLHGGILSSKTVYGSA